MATERKPRRSVPAANKPVFKQASARTSEILDASGPNRTVLAEEEKPVEVSKSIYIPLTKASNEEQTVTGVVLQPNVVDAHGDIMSAEVIRKAAHNFLESYNKATKLGLQHKNFKKQFQLLESYIAPHGLTLGNQMVGAGAWIIVVKVLDSGIWDKVKKGQITGFSIGGTARAKKLAN